MRKDFGVKPWFYPLPVLIIGTYDKNGAPNARNTSWGGLYDANLIQLCLDADRKSTQNILSKKAFTVSFADASNVAACDYVGIVSENNTPDKMEKAGFSVEKSKFVDAPIIKELPLVLECKFLKIAEDGNIIGEIVNVSADERILDENGEIDITKLRPICYDPVHGGYHVIGEKVGQAFSDGNALK